MFNSKTQDTQKPIASKQPEPSKTELVKTDSVRTFSDEQIRVRAYEIYESGDRNGNHPEQDWTQAETELTELLHAAK